MHVNNEGIEDNDQLAYEDITVVFVIFSFGHPNEEAICNYIWDHMKP